MSVTKSNFRKLSTFPYRYVRFSKNIALKKPHIMKKNVNSYFVRCTPGILSQVINEFIFENDHSKFIDHYMMSHTINVIVSAILFNVIKESSKDKHKE